MNKTRRTKPELLAPVGNPSKLDTAIRYGADAVYLGADRFNLRQRAENFSPEQLSQAVTRARQSKVKVYLTANTYPSNHDLKGLDGLLDLAAELEVDAVIAADPGVIQTALNKGLKVHVSTQANVQNWQAARFWKKLGCKRLTLARELSLEEIREIREKAPDVELEVFIHGAICVSYSGRCYLSRYLTGRDANKGDCTHPCRWDYQIIEATRPGQSFKVIESPDNTKIFNSKDLCTIEILDRILELGLDSLKIEGRMKSLYYLALTTAVYRKALNSWAHNPTAFQTDPDWKAQLEKLPHRDYCTGFYLRPPQAEDYRFDTGRIIGGHRFIGVVDKVFQPGTAQLVIKNKVSVNEIIEGFTVGALSYPVEIKGITNLEGESLKVAQPNQTVLLEIDRPVCPGDILAFPARP